MICHQQQHQESIDRSSSSGGSASTVVIKATQQPEHTHKDHNQWVINRRVIVAKTVAA